MVKGDNKKSDTKVETKKPATTPKVTTPKTTTPKVSTPAVKKTEPVGTLATKPTQTIPTTASSNLQPVKSTTPTSSTSSSTSSTSSTASTSPTISGVVPKASIGNKIRGMLNAGRERRAGNAASRGNEARSERLLEKVADSEKKMMMRKGGMIKKMQDGGTSSTKTNMFGKTKEISKAKAEKIGTRFLKKSNNTIEGVDDGNSYTVKPKAKSKRSVTTTFFKAGGAVKSKKK